MQFTSQQSSRLGVGIDFGTSNSAAAVFDGEQITLIKLAAPNSVMPSANYIDKAFQSTIGQLAIDDYIDGNKGRRVELSLELLGEARSGTGGGESAMGGQASPIPPMFMARHSMIRVCLEDFFAAQKDFWVMRKLTER